MKKINFTSVSPPWMGMKTKALYLFVGLLLLFVGKLQAQWTDVGTPGFSAGVADFQSLAFHPTTNQPYVAYRDGANGARTTVMRFDGTAWVNVGTVGFSAGVIFHPSLAFHPVTNEPYVAYRDGGNGGRTTVMRFNGTAWVNVGTAGFSAGASAYLSLAFHPVTNEPYVAYRDQGNGTRTTVMRFNGTAWVNVGTAGFTAAGAEYQSLAFHPITNQPYVANNDAANGNRTTVMRFDGTAWVNVGTVGFSAGTAWFQSLAFHPATNEPYVAYRDFANADRATVMRFDGTAWVNVGTAGFSAGPAWFQSLAFQPTTNEPYVAYQDLANGNRTTVMRFDGTAWVNLGTVGFSAGPAQYQCLAFHPTTQEPYVSYMDLAMGNRMTVKRFALPAPEINLQGNGVDIADGDTSPSALDDTDFGTHNFCTPTPVTRQFTIQNIGVAALSLTGSPVVAISGSSDFTISAQPANTVAVSGSVTFDVTYTPSLPGVQGAVISIASNDTDENSYTFTVQADGGGTLSFAWQDVGTAGFSAGGGTYQSLAFHPGTNEPYVAYQDGGNGNRTTVMRFDGTNWVNVGTAGFSGGGSLYQSMAFHPVTHEPYVAYRDLSNGNRATVMRFDGTNWVNVGTAGFSAGNSEYQSLAFHPTTNEPYVAYRDFSNGRRTTVMRFDGTNWVNVGTVGFSAGQIMYSSLAFHPVTHEPYVAYRDVSNGNRATVMRFDGTNWMNVGTAGFSAIGFTNNNVLAFHPATNEPYVAYQDGGNGRRTTVMRFDGTNWVNVGTAGFSAGNSFWQSLAFHPATDEPYVAYRDQNNGNRTVVMRFDGTAWVNVGTAGFSAGSASYQSLAFHPVTHEPYVGYGDAGNGSRTTVMRFGPNPQPEILISGNGTEIISGAGSASAADDTEFGSTASCGAGVAHTFTIENAGTADLTLSGSPFVALSGADAAQFSITTQPTSGTVVPCPTNAQTFVITYQPNAVGTHTATVTVTNDDSDEGTYTFTIGGTGTDTTDPVLSACPATINLNASASCDAVATWTAPTATDNCGTPTVTSTHNSGDTFPLGTTTVTYTATDGAGLTATCSFDVVVTDVTAPVIAGCPANINLNASGTCDAVATWTAPTVTDNCTGATIAQTGGSASGSTFPLGTTTITYTATDGAGLTATCSFDVVVTDVTAPTIAGCPTNINLNASVSCDAVATWTAPTVTDNCTGATITQTAGSASGSTFPLGTTTITYTATDAAGNTSTCSFDVVVTDVTAPTITGCPTNINLNASASCDAVATWTAPTANDNCSVPMASTHNSGDTFPLGTTTVTYTATDGAGLTATCSFDVIVTDVTAPVIVACPSNINLNASATCDAVATWTAPTVNDNCTGATITQTAGSASGSTFPLGTTTITYTATDGAGLTATCSFDVVVTDVTAPTIAGCTDITVNNDAGLCEATVNWTAPTATDNCAGVTIAQTGGPASGSTFPAGTTPITYTATDAAGNTQTCSFNVIVNDTEDPVAVCQDIRVRLQGTSVTVPGIDVDGGSTDNCGIVSYTLTPDTFTSNELGDNNVTLTVTDAAGNTDVCNAIINVYRPNPIDPIFPPTFIAAYAQDTARIEVKWLHSWPDEDGFYLYRATEDNDYVQIAVVPPGNDTIRYMDTNLDADTQYNYYVRAFKGAQVSTHSDQAEDITYPHTPTVSNTEACYGSSATFVASGTHRSNIYRWYADSLRSSEALKDGSGAEVNTATYQTGYLENDKEVWVRAVGRRYQSWPAKAVATLKPLPAITLLSDANISSCDASEILAIQEVAGAAYQWYRGGEAVAGATSATYEATANNRYRVEVSLNGCTAWSDFIMLRLNRKVDIFIEQGEVARFCDAGTLSATAMNGATYEWRKDGSTLGNARTQDVNESGVYELIANDGTCEVIREITVEIPTFPTDLSLTSSDNDLCPGEEATLSVTSFQGTYNWLRNGRFFTSTDVPTLTTSTPGEYTVEFVAGLCTEQSASFTLNVNDVPQVRIRRDGDELFLSIEDQVTPTSITWFLNDVAQPGLTDERIAPTQVGVYRAELTFGSCPTTSGGKYFAPSTVTDLEDQPELGDKVLVIYPNPTPDALFVQLPQLTGKVSLELVDNLGRTLQRKSQEVSGAETLQLNLKGLPAGTYLLKIHHEELGESLHKIVKE